MPIKVVSRKGTATLFLRGTVRGQSIFESTGTADPEKAEALRAKREAELWDRSVYGAKAVVTFAEAVNSYLDEAPRNARDAQRILLLVKHFGARRLSDIGQDALPGAYRAILRDGMDASPGAKLRGVLAPLRAIMEHAAVNRWCDRPAFKAPAVPRTVTPYLKPEDATRLVQAAADHLRPLLVFLLGTGVRLSEALELDWSKVDLRGARAVVWQKQGNERDVDLPPVVVAALSALPHRDGPVFRPQRRGRAAKNAKPGVAGYADNGRTYGGQIKNAWASACRKAGLPGHWREWATKEGKAMRAWASDVTPHDCRHTWATWHYCVHRDLLRLKMEGGWSTVSMVERYAKKMPDAYRDEAAAWWGAGAKSVHPVSVVG